MLNRYKELFAFDNSQVYLRQQGIIRETHSLPFSEYFARAGQNKDVVNNEKEGIVYTVTTHLTEQEVELKLLSRTLTDPQRIYRLGSGYRIPLSEVSLDNLFVLASSETKKIPVEIKAEPRSQHLNQSFQEENSNNEQSVEESVVEDTNRVIFTRDVDYGSKGKNLLTSKRGLDATLKPINSIYSMHQFITRASPKPGHLTSQIMMLVRPFTFGWH